MKYSILFPALFLSVSLFSQTAIGFWKTIDDEDGKEKSIIHVYEENGQLYGRVKQLLDDDSSTVCTKCKGDKKDQKIEGMVIMEGLKKDGDTYSGGEILDPKNGKVYKCNVELKSPNELNVRGYIGFSLIGRTQTWYRVEE